MNIFLYRKISFLIFAVLFLELTGCASAYFVQSDPPGANVYYLDPDTSKRSFLGSTPLQYSKTSLPERKAFLLAVEKDGYHKIEIPMVSTDQSKTMVNVTLKLDDAVASKSVTEMNLLIRRLFIAQQLIYERKLHAAVVELDKITQEKPGLSQAFVMKGTSFYLLNEIDSARVAWRRALDLDPQNQELLRFLDENKISLEQKDQKGTKK